MFQKRYTCIVIIDIFSIGIEELVEVFGVNGRVEVGMECEGL